jgi:hypothetical protein
MATAFELKFFLKFLKHQRSLIRSLTQPFNESPASRQAFGNRLNFGILGIAFFE